MKKNTSITNMNIHRVVEYIRAYSPNKLQLACDIRRATTKEEIDSILAKHNISSNHKQAIAKFIESKDTTNEHIVENIHELVYRIVHNIIIMDHCHSSVPYTIPKYASLNYVFVLYRHIYKCMHLFIPKTLISIVTQYASPMIEISACSSVDYQEMVEYVYGHASELLRFNDAESILQFIIAPLQEYATKLASEREDDDNDYLLEYEIKKSYKILDRTVNGLIDKLNPYLFR
jgi:hypothetical protein